MTKPINSHAELSREEIRNALIKLGIKSHDDVFGIVPNMDPEKGNALGMVITGYIQFLAKDKEYMDNIIVDYPEDDSITTEEYLEYIHAVINQFQDRDYTQKILNWNLSGSGELRYGSYNLFDLTNRFIEVYLVGKDISSQFAFISGPQEGFFDEYLTVEDKNLIASMKKDRFAFYDYHNASKGVHLATVRWVSMSGAKNLYLGYETENNGVLSISNLHPRNCIQEDKNIQAGLKKYGFVKDLPMNGEKYTDEEVTKIFDDVNAALERTNNQVYVLKKSDSSVEMQFIPDLENCSEILDMPTPNGIRINEFQSEKERDEVARELVDFMFYAQEHGESTVFAGTQYPSDQDGLWGCVHSCRFEHDFTPEYEASKMSASA